MIPGPVTVVVPGDRASIRVLRLVASDLGRLLGFPYDEIENTRLAVNEAASVLLEAGGDQLSCTITGVDGGMSVELGSEPSSVRWPPDGWPDSLGFLVLSRTTSGLRMGPGAKITFTISPPQPPG
jgi:hypothetical protein